MSLYNFLPFYHLIHWQSTILDSPLNYIVFCSYLYSHTLWYIVILRHNLIQLSCACVLLFLKGTRINYDTCVDTLIVSGCSFIYCCSYVFKLKFRWVWNPVCNKEGVNKCNCYVKSTPINSFKWLWFIFGNYLVHYTLLRHFSISTCTTLIFYTWVNKNTTLVVGFLKNIWVK